MTATDDQARQGNKAAEILDEFRTTAQIQVTTYTSMHPGDARPIFDLLRAIGEDEAAAWLTGVAQLAQSGDLYTVPASDPDTDAAYAAEMESWRIDAERDLNPLAEYAINWDEFWHREHAEEWLCEPLFAAGRAHSIYAGAKTGKSWTVLAACAAMATGQPFLGQPCGPPRHVLYVDYEMTEEDIRDRLEQFGYGPDDDLSHLHYLVLPSLPPLDTEDGGRQLLIAAKAWAVVFVIIDTIGRAVAGTENDADTIQAFYRHTGRPLKQAGIGWARLAHSGKDQDRGQRGSSAANDDVDIVLKLTRTDGGQKLTTTHRRMSWYPEATDVAVTENERGVMTFSVAGGHAWPAGTAGIAAELDRLSVPVTMGRPAIRKGWPDLVATNDVLAAAIKYRKSGQMIELAMPVVTLAEKVQKARNGAQKLSGQLAGQANVNRNSDTSPDSFANPYPVRPDSSTDSSDSSPSHTPDSSVTLVTDSPGDHVSDDDPANLF